MIPVHHDTSIYLFCPANTATGGPEALHQLAYHLRKLGFERVFMYYHPDKNKQADPVHEFYKKYAVPYVTEVDNDAANLLIVAETHLDPLFDKQFSEMRKVIWWLSVTNYYIVLEKKLRRAKRNPLYWVPPFGRYVNVPVLKKLKELPVYHISHSYFSRVNLLENGITPDGKISDYMSKAFFDKVNEAIPKEDLVLYNPKKNGAFLEKIIRQSPQLNWVALVDLSPDEVAGYMNRSKVYVDFGYHPGKERMPREACIMRCCLITGKEGSARFTEDMPIPDRYRFEKSDDQIPAILKEIHTCLSNYNLRIDDFENYRQVLLREEDTFIEDVRTVFIKT